jgi:hypothetical protein
LPISLEPRSGAGKRPGQIVPLHERTLQAVLVTSFTPITTILLVALTSNGACLTDAVYDDRARFGETTATMFPDGLRHDFGKVQRGTQARHTFRVVNTSAVPLRIVSLRFG